MTVGLESYKLSVLIMEMVFIIIIIIIISIIIARSLRVISFALNGFIKVTTHTNEKDKNLLQMVHERTSIRH